MTQRFAGFRLVFAVVALALWAGDAANAQVERTPTAKNVVRNVKRTPSLDANPVVTPRLVSEEEPTMTMERCPCESTSTSASACCCMNDPSRSCEDTLDPGFCLRCISKLGSEAVRELRPGSDTSRSAIVSRTVTTLGWLQQMKLLADVPGQSEYFGYSVSIDGDTIVVGAFRHARNGNPSYAGAAYVFIRTGTGTGAVWTFQQKLVADDPGQWDNFGYSVSIDGDTVVVGAYNHGRYENPSYAGAAYVFIRTGTGTGTAWTQQEKLVADVPGQSDYFGYSVSIDGDTVVVGAYRHAQNGNPSYAGAAYVFIRTGTGTSTAWTQQEKLVADVPGYWAYFGHSVSIDGDTVVVGAYNHGPYENPSYAGAAYVFIRTGTGTGTAWTKQEKLVADVPGESDYFGYSVSIDGDTVVVGAHRGGLRCNSGAAYTFTRSAGMWTQQPKLLADDAASDEFGSSVAISGDTVVVGARLDDDGGYDAGSAYTFIQQTELTCKQQCEASCLNEDSCDELQVDDDHIANKKIFVCHKGDADGGDTPLKVINPNYKSWCAHQKHGDELCDDISCCDTVCATDCPP